VEFLCKAPGLSMSGPGRSVETLKLQEIHFMYFDVFAVPNRTCHDWLVPGRPWLLDMLLL